MPIESSSPSGAVPLGAHQTTLQQALLRNAAAFPASPAIVSSSYEPLTYAELAPCLFHVAKTLRSAGLGSHSRILVALREAPQAALAIVSVACSAIAVPIDPSLAPVEIDARLRLIDIDAVLILAGDNSAVRAFANANRIVIVEVRPNAARELTLKVAGPSVPAVSGLHETQAQEAPAVILQSSGTTAQPKLVPCSHANLLATASRVRKWFNLNELDRCLSVSPVYYSHGLVLTVLAPLLSGGSVAFPENPSRIDVKEWFFNLKPTWYSAGPTMHRAILEKVQSSEEALVRHHLRFALSGGARLDAEVQRTLQSLLNMPILEHYGTTETSQVSANLPHPGLAKPGTCGVPEYDTVMIIGEDGAKLPPGDWGELWVGGPTVASGYVDDIERTKAAFIDGWFRTGDRAMIDQDGFLIIGDRLQEVINRGGEKISPMEIEVALLRHPAVAEAAAFAIPHPRLGDDVGAAVVLLPDAYARSDDLRRFLATQLAWFKIPRRIRILDSLPKGTTGKIQRNRLTGSQG